MPQGVVVILTLRTLGIIETAEHVVDTDDVVSSINESVTKDTGTTFGHSSMAGIEIAGLVNGRIQSCKGQQFGRRRKAMNIAPISPRIIPASMQLMLGMVRMTESKDMIMNLAIQ